MDLRLPLSDGQVLYFSVDVVEGDTTLLLRFDVMNKHGLILDFITKQLCTVDTITGNDRSSINGDIPL